MIRSLILPWPVLLCFYTLTLLIFAVVSAIDSGAHSDDIAKATIAPSIAHESLTATMRETLSGMEIVCAETKYRDNPARARCELVEKE